MNMGSCSTFLIAIASPNVPSCPLRFALNTTPNDPWPARSTTDTHKPTDHRDTAEHEA
jgi:hypothetical protein